MLLLATGNPHTDKAIERASRFLALSYSCVPSEASRSKRHAKRHMKREGLVMGTLQAFAPRARDVRIAYDKVAILVNGVPHPRAHLALAIASFCGFHHETPWEFDLELGYVLTLLGTHEAVERARWLYAGASLGIGALHDELTDDGFDFGIDFSSFLGGRSRESSTPKFARRGPLPFHNDPPLRHAFLWGATMAEVKYLAELRPLIRAREGHDPGNGVPGDEIAEIAHASAARRFHVDHRRAMVLWTPPSEPELYEGAPPRQEGPTSAPRSERRPRTPSGHEPPVNGDDGPDARRGMPGAIPEAHNTTLLAMFARFRESTELSDAYADGFLAGGKVCSSLLLTPRRTIPG